MPRLTHYWGYPDLAKDSGLTNQGAAYIQPDGHLPIRHGPAHARVNVVETDMQERDATSRASQQNDK